MTIPRLPMAEKIAREWSPKTAQDIEKMFERVFKQLGILADGINANAAAIAAIPPAGAIAELQNRIVPGWPEPRDDGGEPLIWPGPPGPPGPRGLIGPPGLSEGLDPSEWPEAILPPWIREISDVQTYSPVWASTGTQPAIGDGTLSGIFFRVGRLIWFGVTMIIGTTTTFGTGVYTWTMPVTSIAMTTSRPTFAAFAQQSTGVPFACIARASNTTTFRGIHAKADAFVGATVPFTWATAGDFFIASGFYVAEV